MTGQFILLHSEFKKDEGETGSKIDKEKGKAIMDQIDDFVHDYNDLMREMALAVGKKFFSPLPSQKRPKKTKKQKKKKGLQVSNYLKKNEQGAK